MVHRSQAGLHGIRGRDVLGHIVKEQGDVQAVDKGSCPRLLAGAAITMGLVEPSR